MTIQSSRITLTLREPYYSLLLHHAKKEGLPVAIAASSILTKYLSAAFSDTTLSPGRWEPPNQQHIEAQLAAAVAELGDDEEN